MEKIRVKKDYENIFKENEIIEIANIYLDSQDNSVVVVIFIRNNELDYAIFSREEINDYLEFNYKEEALTDGGIWVKEEKMHERLNAQKASLTEEINYWKEKCMKLIDKI